MARVVLTHKQAIRVHEIVTAFYKRACESTALPPQLLLILKVVHGMIEDEIPFSQNEYNIIKWILESYFENFSETDIDPQAEKAYCKIAGYFYFPEHYKDRVAKHTHVVGYTPPELRPPLGF